LPALVSAVSVDCRKIGVLAAIVEPVRDGYNVTAPCFHSSIPANSCISSGRPVRRIKSFAVGPSGLRRPASHARTAEALAPMASAKVCCVRPVRHRHSAIYRAVFAGSPVITSLHGDTEAIAILLFSIEAKPRFETALLKVRPITYHDLLV